MEPWLKAYLDRLEEIRLQHINHLVSGAAQDHGDYRHVCGVLKGVAVAERELKELLSEVESN
jgi:hypothetical protein|tara:strand:+ start:536 stop:721 length:186 start_codon:yes stop_codon:yes gene_type:complete